MLSFDNTHIFTGYLKQLLSSFNMPTCKIYTSEFAEYLSKHDKEDPRIVMSFDTLDNNRLATRINYLKNNEIYNAYQDTTTKQINWKRNSNLVFDKTKKLCGITRNLYSPGTEYDTVTHEYLGEYLRFLRDYYNINLMSLYNCFNNKIYTNIQTRINNIYFDSRDTRYKIYAFPVKLFEHYTIAIDCSQGVELFCGFYKTSLYDSSDREKDLIVKTYKKINKTVFNRPFIFDKLSVDNWPQEDINQLVSSTKIARCDILNREQDLKLFIKMPTSCKSSVVVLEGDYTQFNDTKYTVAPDTVNSFKYNWTYTANHSITNFDNKDDLNSFAFKPISKVQLLAFNTGESYPFAERLIEYLSGSAITAIDDISDNIKRVQQVMSDNGHFFKIHGLWENQIQKIAYDYMINSGPIKTNSTNDKLIDERRGIHPKTGYVSKSNLFDILGYIDKDVEKCYSSWKIEDNKAKVSDSIQNVDIYNKLFDI